MNTSLSFAVTRAARSVVHRLVVPAVSPPRRLAVLAWSNLQLEEGEPELRELGKIVPPGCRTAVDAGANIGFYTFRLARFARQVCAFEINSGITEHLSRAQLPNVTLYHSGLSDTERDVTLYVPLLNGTLPLYGWASLEPGNCPDTNQHLELAGHVRPLDSFGLKDVDFIKIDVERHELHVLQGARETLRAYRPRILVELKDPPEVVKFFDQIGYRALRAEDFGVHGSPPWMYVFEPRRD